MNPNAPNAFVASVTSAARRAHPRRPPRRTSTRATICTAVRRRDPSACRASTLARACLALRPYSPRPTFPHTSATNHPSSSPSKTPTRHRCSTSTSASSAARQALGCPRDRARWASSIRRSRPHPLASANAAHTSRPCASIRCTNATSGARCCTRIRACQRTSPQTPSSRAPQSPCSTPITRTRPRRCAGASTGSLSWHGGRATRPGLRPARLDVAAQRAAASGLVVDLALVCAGGRRRPLPAAVGQGRVRCAGRRHRRPALCLVRLPQVRL